MKKPLVFNGIYNINLKQSIHQLTNLAHTEGEIKLTVREEYKKKKIERSV